MIARRPIQLRHAASALASLVLLALIGSCTWDLPTSFRVAAARSAPVPDSPVGVVRLLQWCWNNRDLPHYREIFTDDFGFGFASTDTAGNPYTHIPWTREDELVCAQRIFAAASSISLIFNGDLTAQPDFRPGKTYPWHQQVEVAGLTLTISWKDGSATRATGGALFYLVRGDSAVIPQDLLDQGFKPDRKRWYIQRWEDQSNLGGVTAARASLTRRLAAVAPATTLPTRQVTWGRIKLLYR